KAFSHIAAVHDLHPAVDVGIGDIVVSFFITPLIGHHHPTIAQFDEFGIHEHLRVLAHGGGRLVALAYHLGIAPGPALVLTAAYVNVPTKMVVRKGHQPRPVGQLLDSGIIKVLL